VVTLYLAAEPGGFRVSTVQDYLRHGFSTEAILDAFPGLRPADVEEARRLLAAAG
jgi:uncharacterized protein (DUF433 family)